MDDYRRRCFYWLATYRLRVLPAAAWALSMPPIRNEPPLRGVRPMKHGSAANQTSDAFDPNNVFARTMNNVADEGPYRAKYGGLVVGERDWHLTPEQRHYAAKATRDAARARARERAAALRRADQRTRWRSRGAVNVDVDALGEISDREADMVEALLQQHDERCRREGLRSTATMRPSAPRSTPTHGSAAPRPRGGGAFDRDPSAERGARERGAGALGGASAASGRADE